MRQQDRRIMPSWGSEKGTTEEEDKMSEKKNEGDGKENGGGERRKASPTRIVVDESGYARPPRPGDRYDVVFHRRDGWSLAAPERLRGVARGLWEDEWERVEECPGTVAGGPAADEDGKERKETEEDGKSWEEMWTLPCGDATRPDHPAWHAEVVYGSEEDARIACARCRSRHGDAGCPLGVDPGAPPVGFDRHEPCGGSEILSALAFAHVQGRDLGRGDSEVLVAELEKDVARLEKENAALGDQLGKLDETADGFKKAADDAEARADEANVLLTELSRRAARGRCEFHDEPLVLVWRCEVPANTNRTPRPVCPDCLEERIEQLEAGIRAEVAAIPGNVVVREEGGLEDVLASLAVSVGKLKAGG